MKAQPIPHTILETTRPGFIQILLHCSVLWKITSLYFFLAQASCILWKKEPIKVSNFKLSISPSLYLDRLLLLKVYKISAKKLLRSCVSWHCRLMQNLKKKWFVVSKLIRIWWILIRALKSLKNLHFDLFLPWKVCNVWSKKVQRSYLSWHYRVMQNLKKNWPVVWRITWGI